MSNAENRPGQSAVEKKAYWDALNKLTSIAKFGEKYRIIRIAEGLTAILLNKEDEDKEVIANYSLIGHVHENIKRKGALLSEKLDADQLSVTIPVKPLKTIHGAHALEGMVCAYNSNQVVSFIFTKLYTGREIHKLKVRLLTPLLPHQLKDPDHMQRFERNNLVKSFHNLIIPNETVRASSVMNGVIGGMLNLVQYRSDKMDT